MTGDPLKTTPFVAETADFERPAAGEIRQLAQYRIVRPLGDGGMGLVFEALDQQLRRSVALKVMKPKIADNPAGRSRFLQEARAAAALKHDHIVTIYQVGEDQGVPFLAMELLKGKSLEEWLRPDRRATVSETLSIGRQMLKGLEAAHTAGLVHRDIKPANLWLEAPRGRVKILDFGLARMRAFDIKGPGGQREVVGTPAYMAPEQVRGEAVDRRCDLFSAGCVFYRMLTGQLPFQGAHKLEVMQAVETHTPPTVSSLNADVPERLSQLIERLLAKEAAARPSTAQAVLEELQQIEKEFKSAASTLPAAQDDSVISGFNLLNLPTRQRYAWPAAVIAVASIVALLAWRGGFQRDPTPTAATVPAPSANSAPPQRAPEPDALEASGTSTTGAIDLMPLIDTNRDAHRGRWFRTADTIKVRTGSDLAVLKLPWNPPPAYQLSMTITRLNTDDGGVALGLGSGDARFVMLLDASIKGKRFSGLAEVESQRGGLPDRDDAVRGRLLRLSKSARIVCTVKPDLVHVTCDDREIENYTGDLQELVPPPNPVAPLLLSCRNSYFEFSAIELTPLGSDRGKPLAPVP